MAHTLERIKGHVTWQDINEALEAVDAAEMAVASCKKRVGEMIRMSYMDRGIPVGSDGAIHKSNLYSVIKGRTFSRPAVERYIDHLRSHDMP